MSNSPKVYLTSNVFKEIGSNEKISQKIREKIEILWARINLISNLNYFDGRFPTEDQIKEIVRNFNPEIIGCHLSHQISSEILENSEIFAIATSTAGYNHIQRHENDDILIAHTPGVLHETVADYTIAIIMANLRNLIDLHNYVWDGKWIPENKWDLDQSLSSIINNKVLGIIGLGEIGKELVKRLQPWGLKILYYDIKKSEQFSEKFPEIEFRSKMEDIFRESDIVSLHIPLNKYTEKLINRNFLKLMKKNALLVNTARGGVLNLEDLLELLEKKEIQINLSFDVYPQEPIDPGTLERFKKIKEENKNIRMVLIPHNASADADTRGKMDILFLEDIINIIESSNINDLSNVHIIPEHKSQLTIKKWRIYHYWERKKND